MEQFVNKMILSAFAGIGLFLLPQTSFAASAEAPAAFAAPAEAPLVFAQDFNVQVGPGGVRLRGEREVDRDDRWRERERFRERRQFRESDDDRFDRGRRVYGRVDRCRIVVIRRETPYGTRVSRVRRCG